MPRLTIRWAGAVGALFALLTYVPAGFSQAFSRATVSRPSQQGPSTIVGRVGGVFTGRFDTGPQASILNGGGGLFGTQQFGGATGRRLNSIASATGILPNVPARGALGSNLASSFTNLSLALPTFDQRATQLSYASGMASAMSLDRPLGMSPLQGLPPLSAPVVRAAASPYHEFFGLVTADPRDDRTSFERQFVPQTSLAEHVSSALDEREVARRAAAIEAFRNATEAGAPNKIDRLIRATRLLEDVRFTQRHDFVPCVLLAHVALEREKTLTALTNLSEAARRQPNFFASDFDVASYFGDPDALRRQLQSYIQIAARGAEKSPESAILEAYCAFLLDDTRRARDAVERAEEMARAQDFSRPAQGGGVRDLIWALRSALETRP